MPPEGVELSPKDHLLSDDEIVRLAASFVRAGVRKIRLTGGEPLVHPTIVELIGAPGPHRGQRCRPNSGAPQHSAPLPALTLLPPSAAPRASAPFSSGRLNELPGLESIAMTTNGITFARRAADLRQAGLDNVNISLDTLKPARFEIMTRRKGAAAERERQLQRHRQ